MSEYDRRNSEALGSLYIRHVFAMTAEGLHEKSAIAGELAWRDSEIERLTAELAKANQFKAYVHRRLDEAGVPSDPDSPHKAEGCRIGGRLDIVLGEISLCPLSFPHHPHDLCDGKPNAAGFAGLFKKSGDDEERM